tara:strand:+ start:74 stop:1084 length:1011 start_codon:yes stop_codon:yes gene_type:complete
LNILLSIIIPHLKGTQNLNECLSSIQTNIAHEIIIVDNNSQDGSVKVAKENFPNIHVVHSNVNKGYAGGCNLGAKNAKGDYLLFLNDDTIISENAIDILFNMIKENDNISAVQPKILNYYNKDCFDYAGASGGYIDYLGYPFSRGRIFNTIEKDVGQYNDRKKIFWASGTAFITKKNIFNKIGQFDEKLFAHMEEIDYHWKCHLNNYDVYVEPKAIIYHKGGETLKYGSYKKVYLNHRNSMILFLTNNKNLSLLTICKRFLLEILACFYYLFTIQIKSAIAVKMSSLWCLANIKYLRKRKKTINSKIKINPELMVTYSIVKKYFFNKKQFYKNIDQ